MPRTEIRLQKINVMSKIKPDKKGKPAEKKVAVKASYSLKRKVISEISNGRISRNYASKKYQISRSTLEYWMQKFSTLEDKQNHMNKNDEIKKLKNRIEILELVDDFQKDLIAEFEKETGDFKSKKSLPEQHAKEIARRRKQSPK